MTNIWKKYPHIERLNSEEVEGLLELPDIWVEPKIDGANASVFLDEQGRLRVAKRTATIPEDQDFRGLYKYVLSEKENYLNFFKKYPNTIIYGEWLIKHSIKDYRLSAWNKLYAFDILNTETQQFYCVDKRIEMLKEFNILQIVPLVRLQGPIISEINLELLNSYVDKNKFLIDDDKIGEGIVIKAFNTNGKPFINKYGRCTWAKIVRQEFKELNGIEMGVNERQAMQDNELLFISTFVTKGRLDKIKQKIMDNHNTGWQSNYIGELLGRVWHDIFTEELWGFVKNNRVKNFNFKVANKYCTLTTKQLMGL